MGIIVSGHRNGVGISGGWWGGGSTPFARAAFRTGWQCLRAVHDCPAARFSTPGLVRMHALSKFPDSDWEVL